MFDKIRHVFAFSLICYSIFGSNWLDTLRSCRCTAVVFDAWWFCPMSSRVQSTKDSPMTLQWTLCYWSCMSEHSQS